MLVTTDNGDVTLFRGFVKAYDKTIYFTAIGPVDNVYPIDEDLYIQTGEIKKQGALYV
jgi:hypothetical protein